MMHVVVLFACFLLGGGGGGLHTGCVYLWRGVVVAVAVTETVVVVNWCFTPTQPVGLYQGDTETVTISRSVFTTLSLWVIKHTHCSCQTKHTHTQNKRMNS